jgi:Family of unknown function (DUF6703)
MVVGDLAYRNRICPLSWPITGREQGRTARLSTNRASQSRQPGSGQARRSRQPRPLPKGSTLLTPDASPGRQAVEQRSATPLLWMHQLPVWLLPVLAVGLLVAGLAAKGIGGAIALGVLAVILGWLAVVSWPRLSAQSRLLRVVVVGAVLAAAVVRGLHH